MQPHRTPITATPENRITSIFPRHPASPNAKLDPDPQPSPGQADVQDYRAIYLDLSQIGTHLAVLPYLLWTAITSKYDPRTYGDCELSSSRAKAIIPARWRGDAWAVLESELEAWFKDAQGSHRWFSYMLLLDGADSLMSEVASDSMQRLLNWCQAPSAHSPKSVCFSGGAAFYAHCRGNSELNAGFTFVHLAPLWRDELEALLHSYPDVSAPNLSPLLWELSGGHPYLVKCLLSVGLSSASQTEVSHCVAKCSGYFEGLFSDINAALDTWHIMGCGSSQRVEAKDLVHYLHSFSQGRVLLSDIERDFELEPGGAGRVADFLSSMGIARRLITKGRNGLCTGCGLWKRWFERSGSKFSHRE